MTRKVVVEKEGYSDEINRFKYAADLEAGDILFFPMIPFSISEEELKSQQGLELYSQKAALFLSQVLAPYADAWIPGMAHRSPARSDRLTLEASSLRPLNGGRILQFFTNFHPTQSQQWITSHKFGDLAMMFGGKQISFPKSLSYSMVHRLFRKTKKAFHRIGIGLPLKSPYDLFMLRMQNFLKKNDHFQQTCPKDIWEFPPHSCWALYTDLVAHASCSNQDVIEQSFVIPQRALLFPDKSPLGVLERMTQGNLVIAEI